jgi:hypothetical protein
VQGYHIHSLENKQLQYLEIVSNSFFGTIIYPLCSQLMFCIPEGWVRYVSRQNVPDSSVFILLYSFSTVCHNHTPSKPSTSPAGCKCVRHEIVEKKTQSVSLVTYMTVATGLLFASRYLGSGFFLMRDYRCLYCKLNLFDFVKCPRIDFY